MPSYGICIFLPIAVSCYFKLGIELFQSLPVGEVLIVAPMSSCASRIICLKLQDLSQAVGSCICTASYGGLQDLVGSGLIAACLGFPVIVVTISVVKVISIIHFFFFAEKSI